MPDCVYDIHFFLKLDSKEPFNQYLNDTDQSQVLKPPTLITMKRKFYLLRTLALFIGVLIGVLLTLISCNGDKPTACNFEGVVLDQDSAAVADASVEIGGETTTTDEDGRFCINTEIQKENPRYVLNIEKLGFGLVSKIYQEPTKEITITMTTATVVEDLATEADEEGVVVIEDTTPPPPESAPLSTSVSMISSPLDTIPFIFKQGRLTGFGSYLELGQTYEAMDQFIPQNQGASVEIDLDDLEVDAASEASFLSLNQNKRKGITGSLSTVDIYNPDGMPGDYTYRSLEGEPGFMQTFGAADINFFQDNKPMQLKKGKYATLRIPVEQVAANGLKGELPETIPLLIYDKKTGEWKDDKDKWTGNINRGRLITIKDQELGEIKVYEAKISHFSVYNMDEEFTNPSCTKIFNPNSDPFETGARLEVAVPGHVNDYLIGPGCPGICGSPDSTVHAIARMLRNQAIGLRIFDPSGNIKSTRVLVGGNPSIDIYWAGCSTDDNGNSQIDICECTSEIKVSYNPDYVDPDGTTPMPIVAVEKLENEPADEDSVIVSWVYIPDVDDTVTPPDYTNSVITYKVEWSSDNFTSVINPLWPEKSTEEWIVADTIPINATNFPPGAPTLKYFFRVRADLPGPGTPSDHSILQNCLNASGTIVGCL